MVPRTFRSAALFLLPIALAFLAIFFNACSAHADPAPVIVAAVPPGWSGGEVMALIALVVAGVHGVINGVRAVLHFVAPRTTTTLDDRAAAALDSFHARLTKLEALIPAAAAALTPPAAPPAKPGSAA